MRTTDRLSTKAASSYRRPHLTSTKDLVTNRVTKGCILPQSLTTSEDLATSRVTSTQRQPLTTSVDREFTRDCIQPQPLTTSEDRESTKVVSRCLLPTTSEGSEFLKVIQEVMEYLHMRLTTSEDLVLTTEVSGILEDSEFLQRPEYDEMVTAELGHQRSRWTTRWLSPKTTRPKMRKRNKGFVFLSSFQLMSYFFICFFYGGWLFVKPWRILLFSMVKRAMRASLYYQGKINLPPLQPSTHACVSVAYPRWSVV